MSLAAKKVHSANFAFQAFSEVRVRATATRLIISAVQRLRRGARFTGLSGAFDTGGGGGDLDLLGLLDPGAGAGGTRPEPQRPS